jgi:hypothetical protein
MNFLLKKFAINFSSLLLILVGYVFITNHNYEYGDQASENIFFLETWDNYIKDKSNNNYFDYIIEKNNSLYIQKYSDKEQRSIGIEINGPTSLKWEPETVKVLNRILNYSLKNYIFISSTYSEIFYYLSIILIIINYSLFFYLGKILIDERFGVVLASIICANIYLLQLQWSSLEPQLNYFVTLLGLGLISIYRNVNTKNSLRLVILIASITTACSLLNGYPNTQLSLPLFLAIALLIRPKNIYPRLVYLLLGIFIGIVIYFLISVIYSRMLGKDDLYTLGLFTNRFGAIINGSATNLDGSILEVIYRVIRNIFVGTDFMHAPHGSGMLLNISFLNIFEGLCLLICIKKIINGSVNSTVKGLLLSSLLFFSIRVFTNDNNIIDKDSLDFYFPLLFLVAYGAYFLLDYDLSKNRFYFIYKNFICQFSYSSKYRINTYINLKKSNIVKVGSSLLLISILFNLLQFNFKFVQEYDASLWEMSGLRQVRDYVTKNATAKSYIFVNYHHGFENSVYRINFFNTDAKIYSLSSINDVLKSNENLSDLIEKEIIDNIIIIDRGNGFHIAKYFSNLGNTFKQPETNKFFSYLFPTYEAENNLKIPVYNIYNINKNNLYNIIDIEKNNPGNNYELKVNKKGSLIGLDLPSHINNFSLFCNGTEKLTIDNSDNKFDYISIKSNGNYKSIVYNLFNNQLNNGLTYKLLNSKVISLEEYNRSKNLGVNTVFGLEKINSSANISLSLINNFGYSISNITVSTPYILYNDLFLRNSIQVKLFSLKNSSISKVPFSSKEVFSDGKMRYPSHTYINGMDEYRTSMLFKKELPESSTGYQIDYKINSTSSNPTTIWTNFYGYDKSLNYIKIDGTDSKLSFNGCTDNFMIKYTLKDFNKISNLNSYIGYSINAN